MCKISDDKRTINTKIMQYIGIKDRSPHTISVNLLNELVLPMDLTILIF